jgi:integrase
MSAKKSVRIPKYRQHRPSGRAVVRINGHDFYLGKFNSPESHAEYERLVGEWITGSRQTPADISPARRGVLSINDLILAYATFADGYYRKNGIPTGEYDCIRYSLRPLRKLYGNFPVQQFGPLALKNVREDMLKGGTLCRKEINKRIGRIVRMFKWGVENELVDPMIHHALAQVKGLARGRCSVRESQPVKPVSGAHIEAVRPLVSRQVRAMIDLQLLTGMRPGEVCQIRTGDIDRTQAVWVYRPGSPRHPRSACDVRPNGHRKLPSSVAVSRPRARRQGDGSFDSELL